MRHTLYMECRETEVKNGKTVTHSKFYQISDNGDGTLTTWFGKIGTEGRKQVKPISDWFDIVQKRKDHGYKEVSSMSPIDPHAELRMKQLEKVNVVLNLIRGPLRLDQRSVRSENIRHIEKIKENLESKVCMLTAKEMLFLNDVYKKLKKEK